MKMVDLNAPRTLEILISQDGTKVWINTEEEGCVFRAQRITTLYIHDERKKNEKK